jgi:hypothetical protein
MIKKIRFIKEIPGRKVGDKIPMRKDTGDFLVAQGVAEWVTIDELVAPAVEVAEPIIIEPTIDVYEPVKPKPEENKMAKRTRSNKKK